MACQHLHAHADAMRAFGFGLGDVLKIVVDDAVAKSLALMPTIDDVTDQ